MESLTVDFVFWAFVAAAAFLASLNVFVIVLRFYGREADARRVIMRMAPITTYFRLGGKVDVHNHRRA